MKGKSLNLLIDFVFYVHFGVVTFLSQKLLKLIKRSIHTNTFLYPVSTWYVVHKAERVSSP